MATPKNRCLFLYYILYYILVANIEEFYTFFEANPGAVSTFFEANVSVKFTFFEGNMAFRFPLSVHRSLFKCDS